MAELDLDYAAQLDAEGGEMDQKQQALKQVEMLRERGIIAQRMKEAGFAEEEDAAALHDIKQLEAKIAELEGRFKGGEMLTGTELHKAVVRKRWKDAFAGHGAHHETLNPIDFRIMSSAAGTPGEYGVLHASVHESFATEAEAWHAAAVRVLEDAYVINRGDATGLWFVVRLQASGEEMFPYYDTRELAEESAMRDYLGAATQPAQPKPDAADAAKYPSDGELVIVRHRSSARYLIAYRKYEGWWDNSDDGPIANDSVAAWESLSAPHSRDQPDLRESHRKLEQANETLQAENQALREALMLATPYAANFVDHYCASWRGSEKDRQELRDQLAKIRAALSPATGSVRHG